MARKSKSSFHHGNLREDLLTASLSILDELGPDAIAIREVARRAGVSHAAPVNHFKDREALLTEVAVILFGELAKDITRYLQKPQLSRADRVKAFADGLIRYGLKHPNRYRMLWRRDLVDNTDDRLVQAMDSIYDDLLVEISQSKKKRGVDDDTIAIGLWSMAHGYVSMRLDENFDAAKDKVTGQKRQDAMLDAFLLKVGL
jgi:AcrR family transcriptional regulator